jgi:hypothetical protein
MQLNKIQQLIDEYKVYLAKNYPYRELNLYKWESLNYWQNHWDTEALNFREMYNESLQNSTNRRIWSREHYAPKQMMLIFIDLQPEFVRSMFRELFNESKEVAHRIDRFLFYCDHLMALYKEQKKKPVENIHFHTDYEIISYYLAFQYPSQYTPYSFAQFHKTMALIGSKEVPQSHDVPRFFKVARTLYGFLKKDESLLALHQNRLELESNHYQKETLLLADDFMSFICNK